MKKGIHDASMRALSRAYMECVEERDRAREERDCWRKFSGVVKASFDRTVGVALALDTAADRLIETGDQEGIDRVRAVLEEHCETSDETPV